MDEFVGIPAIHASSVGKYKYTLKDEPGSKVRLVLWLVLGMYLVKCSWASFRGHEKLQGLGQRSGPAGARCKCNISCKRVLGSR